MSIEVVAEETVAFRRRAELPGVEIRDVENSSRLWRCFSVGFEFLAPRTWSGEFVCRRRQHDVSPGSVFCSYPGEVYSAARVYRPGGGSALVVDPEALDAALREQGLSANRLELRRVARMSHSLASELDDVFRLMNPASSALELQSAYAVFLQSMLGELLEHSLARSDESADDAAEGVREHLHFDASARTDLATLSEQSGLSRFQVLRAFKRRYGLPPHAYQLRVRIGLAQKALRAGRKPAEVAADYGFVDQSHFSRHFKHLVGVTPAQYMSLGRPKKSVSSRKSDQGT